MMPTPYYGETANHSYIYLASIFQAQDEECQIITEREGAKWPPLTPEGQWKKRTLELDPGVYVLHWKTIGIEVHGPSRPVLIKSVHISGEWLG